MIRAGKEGTKGAAWRVGLFGLAGLALLALAIVLAAGHWFVPREAALMRFTTSVYGLQVGAPVVFRGVRLGQITEVSLSAASGAQGVTIPVQAEFERALLRTLVGSEAPAVQGGPLVPELVARGLVARLATQSLLTGQLYVDLDIDAARARPAGAGAGAGAGAPTGAAGASGGASTGSGTATTGAARTDGLPVIPTAPSQLQSLQAQLEGLDLGQIGRDLAATTASLRQLLGGPEPARMIASASQAALSLQRLVERIEREVAPLSRSAQGAFGEGQRAALAVGQGASDIAGSARQAAQQVAQAASQAQVQVGALTAAGVAALAQVQRSAEAVTQAAQALQGAAGDDSRLRLNAERALADVSRAARSLRELAELLERHPDALVRGRAGAP
ncbi:MAG: MCE family protein [Rubrivivax sp.]|nr:MCE family protein [Rubrivivax sp.]